jgi:hypothetical protein
VWAKAGAVAHSCPKSFITPESLAFLEEFWAWKLIGGASYTDLPARLADAFCVLESEHLKKQSG